MTGIGTQIKNALGWLLTRLKGNVVNNLTSTSTDLPLSAAKGKDLQDQITSLNTNMKNIKSQTYTVTTNSDRSFTINFGKNVIVIAAGGVASYAGCTFGRINGFSVWGFNSTYLKNATFQVDVTYIEG